MYKRYLALVAVFLIGSGVANASAIVSTSSSVLELAGPAVSLQKDVVESNTTIFAYSERKNVLLGSTLLVDYTGTGTYQPQVTNEPSLAPINAGTLLDSYVFHFDIIYTGSARRLVGTITFDSDILGIIGNQFTLMSTDTLLGNPGTAYEKTVPQAGAGRGLEGADFSTVASRDWITVSNDRRTLTLDLGAGDWFDDVRVLVAGSNAVPLPATLPLLGIGLAALAVIRRRSNASEKVACPE